MNLREALRLLRPRQWPKNLLVFAALIFARRFDDPESVRLALLAFLAMCLLSSAVYALNDVRDAERDRAHPVKRNRPVASGAVGAGAAVALALVCLAIGLAVSMLIGRGFLAGVGVYLAIQVAYNLALKQIPVLDVFTVSLGFVLRAALGAAAIAATISSWLLFCTGALALLLASAKRRHEFRLQGDDRAQSRRALASYTERTLDALVVFSATVAALSYGVYAIESPSAVLYPALPITIPFVLYGIARYLFLVFSGDEGGEPERLLYQDLHILLCVVLFLGAAFVALTGVRLPYVG